MYMPNARGSIDNSRFPSVYNRKLLKLSAAIREKSIDVSVVSSIGGGTVLHLGG